MNDTSTNSIHDQKRAEASRKFNEALRVVAEFVGMKIVSGIPMAQVIAEVEDFQSKMIADDDANQIKFNMMQFAVEHALDGLRKSSGEKY